MPDTPADLLRRRSAILEQIAQLGSFRAGSITTLVRRCGKRGCRCTQPGDPGHGPNIRLTYKLDGRTRSESLTDPLALRKAQKEIAEFRRYQALAREFVAINARLCRLPAPAQSYSSDRARS